MKTQSWIRRLLYPDFPMRELPGMLGLTLLGAIAGGLYGIFHDQVTFSISPEYFTRLKFDQFRYADPGTGPERLFAGIIGFLASWWVGALTAWILSRVSLFHERRIAPFPEMIRAFSLVFLTSMLTAVGGWIWGLWRQGTGYDESWIDFMSSLGVEDETAFMTVAYIHNASYLGGVSGSVIALIYLARVRGKRIAEGVHSQMSF